MGLVHVSATEVECDSCGFRFSSDHEERGCANCECDELQAKLKQDETGQLIAGLESQCDELEKRNSTLLAACELFVKLGSHSLTREQLRELMASARKAISMNNEAEGEA